LVDEETLPESDSVPGLGDGGAADLLSLVVAWSRDEPWRLGQSLLIPPGDPGPLITFGRGPVESDCEKRLLERHRFGLGAPEPPLATASISRRQLELRSAGDRLYVRNVGRCKLTLNGVSTSEAECAPGDNLQLGKQVLFVVAKRSSRPCSGIGGYPEFAFGEADTNGIVGESSVAWQLRAHIGSIAPRRGHVLISGPSGSGKELTAQAVHALSRCRQRKLIARSAATIPETLIDAELFGNSKNYPNPGMIERPGLVGEAHGSTLFLDEIAELPHGSQAHLLRLLDSGQYHRLGEATARQAEIRLVAATNRDPSSLKHDLLARLTLRIVVPSLTERREDVPLLARHIVRRAAAGGDDLARSVLGAEGREPAFDIDFVRQLVEHRYELGARELETLLWRHLATPELTLRPESNGGLAASIQPTANDAPPNEQEGLDRRTAAEIQRCLDENNGVVELTWRALGMKNRFVLIRAIKKYGLEIRRRPGRPPGETRGGSRRE
jgi:DNA-binding NtrC family response regulator